MKKVVVEVPEPAGRTRDGARGHVVAALSKHPLPDGAVTSRHEAVEYWHPRVKSFDRVLAAVAQRPLDVVAARRLAEALLAVTRGRSGEALELVAKAAEALGALAARVKDAKALGGDRDG